MFLLGSGSVRCDQAAWSMACARAVEGTAQEPQGEDGGCGLCERPRDHGSLGGQAKEREQQHEPNERVLSLLNLVLSDSALASQLAADEDSRSVDLTVRTCPSTQRTASGSGGTATSMTGLLARAVWIAGAESTLDLQQQHLRILPNSNHVIKIFGVLMWMTCSSPVKRSKTAICAGGAATNELNLEPPGTCSGARAGRRMLGIFQEAIVSIERDWTQVIKAARQQAAIIVRDTSPERASFIMMETKLRVTANLTEMSPFPSHRKASRHNSPEPRYYLPTPKKRRQHFIFIQTA
ncbi:uncharacterized protein M421DRAFT_93994 [Didymella exigua CBS 183.55]|uniref:Uncharacterized protein n=1 Tax=Didymella exigua CBS 183.55 TaxID=1150837 RepID=A0A6A5RFG0_9PLEO|nr:uncharacterized protein M421DRAFT_93994 [Didymella exigua CBS 183.55]KAF1926452.1 hypothetical protein M421DRAFT_93994 [Didymella exigua CBS 183.55]